MFILSVHSYRWFTESFSQWACYQNPRGGNIHYKLMDDKLRRAIFCKLPTEETVLQLSMILIKHKCLTLFVELYTLSYNDDIIEYLNNVVNKFDDVDVWDFQTNQYIRYKPDITYVESLRSDIIKFKNGS